MGIKESHNPPTLMMAKKPRNYNYTIINSHGTGSWCCGGKR